MHRFNYCTILGQFGDAKSVAQRISASQPILTLLSEFFPTVVNHSTSISYELFLYSYYGYAIHGSHVWSVIEIIVANGHSCVKAIIHLLPEFFPQYSQSTSISSYKRFWPIDVSMNYDSISCSQGYKGITSPTSDKCVGLA